LQKVGLFTTVSQYPWYRTTVPLTLTLPARKINFQYRYAIHRAGVFLRWEGSSDAPEDLMTTDTAVVEFIHEVPLHHLRNRESYVVSDVLGSNRVSDVEHVPPPTKPVYSSATTLHAHPARSNSASEGLARAGGSGAHLSSASPAAPAVRKKAVSLLAPTPPHAISPRPVRQAVHLNSTDGLVVVSIFLPVIVLRSADGKWSADWDYEMLLSMQTHLRVTRLGVVKWRGAEGTMEIGVPRSERLAVEECLRPFNCVPVWVEPHLFGEMYNGFCKGVLWPVLHNVTNVYSNKSDEDDVVMGRVNEEALGSFSEYSRDDIEQGPIHGGRGREAPLWGAYNTVNRLFAERVVQCFNEGDLVWIHGFHLLILPSYLTRRIPMAKVGIFLHTPFPSSEIFRTVWCREDLLRGMLNADQVGFHLFEYARHFLTSCRRLLGLNYGMIPDSSGGHTLAIDLNGRNVVVTSIHAGVEPPVLHQILQHPLTVEKVNSIRTQYEGKTIFCGIDRLESLKGIPLKLLGLERFLLRCPEWAGKIVLIQVGISAPERGDDYFTTKNEINKLVQKINSNWPNTVEFQECQESDMRLQQRMALLRAADVIAVTSIRDGLNLIPLEFTIAHQDALKETRAVGTSPRQRGMCILSEFSSCTRVMRGALHVNPWKISEIANGYHSALVMTEDERLRRISIASEFVTRVTTQRWALAVMLDLKGVNKNVSPGHYSGAGLGLGYRLLGMDMGFLSLDTNIVAKAYKNAKGRLILMDYGGTIVSNDNVRSILFIHS
jgi:trehalose 6-phosphate synthase/phosphatase